MYSFFFRGLKGSLPSWRFCLSSARTSSEAERRTGIAHVFEVYFLLVKQDCEQSLIFLLRHGRMRARETRVRARASGEDARNKD